MGLGRVGFLLVCIFLSCALFFLDSCGTCRGFDDVLLRNWLNASAYIFMLWAWLCNNKKCWCFVSYFSLCDFNWSEDIIKLFLLGVAASFILFPAGVVCVDFFSNGFLFVVVVLVFLIFLYVTMRDIVIFLILKCMSLRCFVFTLSVSSTILSLTDSQILLNSSFLWVPFRVLESFFFLSRSCRVRNFGFDLPRIVRNFRRRPL